MIILQILFMFVSAIIRISNLKKEVIREDKYKSEIKIWNLFLNSFKANENLRVELDFLWLKSINII